jgi:hypothetical protein
MAEPKKYGFKQQLEWSDGHADQEDVERVLLNRIPAATKVTKADKKNDRQGTDYWVERSNALPPLSVDRKVRDEDFSVHINPKLRGDDLALETWSVMPGTGGSVDGQVGWTRDISKRTDYVLWYWRDTARFCLVPFAPLCFVFGKTWREWSLRFKRRVQTSTGEGGRQWNSECVYVDRNAVFDAMQRWMCNVVRGPGSASDNSYRLESFPWADALIQVVDE